MGCNSICCGCPICTPPRFTGPPNDRPPGDGRGVNTRTGGAENSDGACSSKIVPLGDGGFGTGAFGTGVSGAISVGSSSITSASSDCCETLRKLWPLEAADAGLIFFRGIGACCARKVSGCDSSSNTAVIFLMFVVSLRTAVSLSTEVQSPALR